VGEDAHHHDRDGPVEASQTLPSRAVNNTQNRRASEDDVIRRRHDGLELDRQLRPGKGRDDHERVGGPVTVGVPRREHLVPCGPRTREMLLACHECLQLDHAFRPGAE